VTRIQPATSGVGSPRTTRGRCIIGLSGGVDSAVAAAILIEQGFTVQGVFLDTWHAGTGGAQALAAAETVADHLSIQLRRCDVRQAFYARVVEPFLDTYAAGRTPNPCVLCNPLLKVATLLDAADKVGAEWIATGHYARVVYAGNGMARLYQARAVTKDQSYALYRLGQRHVSRLLMPLGEVASKAEVREIARALNLPAADNDESQDLCFVGTGGYHDLLAALRPDALRPGPILDEAGHHLGDHHGLARFTIGQRGGLGIAAAAPLYVIDLDPARNAVIVGPRARLARSECHLVDVTFVAGAPPTPQFEAMGRIRYRAPLVPVTITMIDPSNAHIAFAEPQSGIAPGQSLVVYDDEEVLGGGIISGPPSSAGVVPLQA